MVCVLDNFLDCQEIPDTKKTCSIRHQNYHPSCVRRSNWYCLASAIIIKKIIFYMNITQRRSWEESRIENIFYFHFYMAQFILIFLYWYTHGSSTFTKFTKIMHNIENPEGRKMLIQSEWRKLKLYLIWPENKNTKNIYIYQLFTSTIDWQLVLWFQKV